MISINIHRYEPSHCLHLFIAICPSFCISKKYKKEIKTLWVPLRGLLMKFLHCEQIHSLTEMTGHSKLFYRQCGGVELRQKNGEETSKKIEALR
jgi:hypothetical protein